MSVEPQAPVPSFGGTDHTFTQVDRLAEAEKRLRDVAALAKSRDAWRERARKLDAILRDARPLIGATKVSPMLYLDVAAAVDGVLAESEPEA